MMHKLLIFSFVFCVACTSNNQPKNFVARVGAQYLLLSDLQQVFGDEIDTNSIQFKSFVHRWLRNEIMAQKAEEMLNPEEKNFDEKLNSYYQSLLRYAYEQKIIHSSLDTLVTEEEIAEYFNNNQQNFELKENVVQVRYLKVPLSYSDLTQFKVLIQYKDSLQRSKLLSLVEKHQVYCVLDDENWIPFEEIKELIPIKIYNDEHFLKHQKYTEAIVEDGVWIVYFPEHRFKDSVSPMEMVKDKIKKIILYQKKIAAIKAVEKQHFDEAIAKGIAEFKF